MDTAWIDPDRTARRPGDAKTLHTLAAHLSCDHMDSTFLAISPQRLSMALGKYHPATRRPRAANALQPRLAINFGRVGQSCASTRRQQFLPVVCFRPRRAALCKDLYPRLHPRGDFRWNRQDIDRPSDRLHLLRPGFVSTCAKAFSPDHKDRTAG